MEKVAIAGFAMIACALTVASGLAELEYKSLPRIKADQAHQIRSDLQPSLRYEVHPGKGFVIDTSDYKAAYAQVAESTLFVEQSKVIRLDPVLPNRSGPASVDLVPGQDLYQVSLKEGLRSGDKFIVQIAEETTDWGHHNFFTRWSAYVDVK